MPKRSKVDVKRVCLAADENDKSSYKSGDSAIFRGTMGNRRQRLEDHGWIQNASIFDHSEPVPGADFFQAELTEEGAQMANGCILDAIPCDYEEMSPAKFSKCVRKHDS